VREPQVFLFDEPLSNLDANLRIEVVEPTGDEILVHLVAGNSRLHVALSGRPSLAIDQTIYLKPRAGAVHLFDAATGARI
jgi:multiple sugar transport system ATP-binding protein